jgi:hypothetical protein
MTMIELDLLCAVVGGGDSTTRTTAGVKAFGAEASVTRESRITDNESCRQDLKAACNGSNRSTFLGMDVGVDRPKADACFVENFARCPK